MNENAFNIMKQYVDKKVSSNLNGLSAYQVAVKNGYTGTESEWLASLGGQSVDLSDYAPITSPSFTGIPTVPTAEKGTNTSQIANTAFVQSVLKPKLLITILDFPSNVTSATVTLTLQNSNPLYSITVSIPTSGIVALSPEYIGTYDISFNNSKIKTIPSINLFLPNSYTLSGYWLETVTYTVNIDKTNSNPETACTYADDALGMTKGSSLWDNMPIFKQIRPCVFQRGRVNYYLNPNNWNEKFGTTEASCLTGEDGDVMIEFLKFAYKIKTINNTITVSVSTDPAVIANDNDYTYDAFSRLEEGDLNFFYKGAFKGYIDGNGKLRSVVGTKPAHSKTIGQFRTAAQLNGAHYQQSTYAQLKALQCLYLIKYGNRNGQAAIGKGVVHVDADASYVSGYNTTDVANISSENSTLTSGMTFGTIENNTTHMRLFGLEDFWGNIQEWIEGVVTDENWNIITSWNSFSNEGITITSITTSTGLTANGYGFINDVIGNSAAGFIPILFSSQSGISASSSTYWADQSNLYASRTLRFGGHWYDNDSAGPFNFLMTTVESGTYNFVSSRLSYV